MFDRSRQVATRLAMTGWGTTRHSTLRSGFVLGVANSAGSLAELDAPYTECIGDFAPIENRSWR